MILLEKSLLSFGGGGLANIPSLHDGNYKAQYLRQNPEYVDATYPGNFSSSFLSQNSWIPWNLWIVPYTLKNVCEEHRDKKLSRTEF